jgi:hypothetical protein
VEEVLEEEQEVELIQLKLLFQRQLVKQKVDVVVALYLQQQN